MKKRIISLLLAVVMLFSCLSLNVFATEPAAEPVESAETNTLTPHTDEQIQAAINAVKIPGTNAAYSNGTTGIAENENVSIKYENGKIVKMGGSASQSRIQLAAHSSLSGRESLQNYNDSNLAIGASFVLQATWNFADAFQGKNETIFQICDYVATNLGAGYSGNKYIPTTDSVMPMILSVNSSMQLLANVATTNANRSNVVVKQLERNVDYTFSIFVDPSYVDEATDTYGKFDVYVNGECVKSGLKLFNKYVNDNNFVFDERTPYFNQSAFSDSAKKILKNGATVYFFSETAPSAEEAAKILADCGITASGSYTVKATGRTKQGVKDLSIGFVRFQMSSHSYTADAFSVDNLMCYYANEFVGTIIEHSLVSTHDHDYTKATTEISSTCFICNGKKVETVTLDANGDRVCDVCVGELPVGALMTPTELKNSGISYKVSTEFNGSATWHGQMNANSNANVCGAIGLRQAEDGNWYVAYGPATKADESGFYAQTNTDAAGRESTVRALETLKGKAYTVAFDVMHDGTIDYNFLLDLYSYTTVAGTKDENGIYTSVSQLNAVNWTPIKIDRKGVLYYRNGATGEFVSTNKQIPVGEFHNIVFYHNPQNNTYSVYLDGECFAANVQALTSSMIAAQTWVATEEAMRAKYGSYVKDSYFEDGLFVMDGAKAWTVGFVRFPQFNSHYKNAIDGDKIKLSEDGKTLTVNGEDFPVDGVKYAVSEPDKNGVRYAYTPTSFFREADFFALDNVKVYYPEDNVECAHDYALTHTHDTANGVNHVAYSCKFCDKVINKEVAMTDFAALNGSGKVLSCEELKALLGADALYTNSIESTGHGFNGAFTNTGNLFRFVTENGRTYLMLGKGDASASTYKAYTQYNLIGNGDYNALRNYPTANFDQIKGKAYVLSEDIMIPENSAIKDNSVWGNLFVGMSYTTGTDGCTRLCPSDVSRFVPIQMGYDGTIKYFNGATGGYVSYAEKLEIGKFYNIAVHHTPKGDAKSPENTYDIYLDGVLIVENVQALTQSQSNAHKFTSGDIVVGGKTYKVVANGAVDYIPGCVQSMQPSSNPSGDVIATDNYKAYYADTFVECAHSYTDSNTCDWCGEAATSAYCDICDGRALNADVAVVGKSVSLGELVDINLYVKNASGKASTATLTCGDKTETFNFADLTADEYGFYRLSLPLNSILMAEDVVLTADGGSYTTSVKEYAEQLIAITGSETEIDLAKALLNYGAAAQVYFAEKNNDASLLELLANASLADEDKVTPELAQHIIDEFSFKAEGQTDDVKFTAISLTLSAKTYVKVYFTASENATVTVNGKTYVPTEENGEYYIVLTVDNPAEATSADEIVITDGETVVSADIAAFTAVVAGNASSNQKLVDLLIAYSWYTRCAKYYVA